MSEGYHFLHFYAEPPRSALAVPLSEEKEAKDPKSPLFGSSFGRRTRDPLEDPTELEAYEYAPHTHDSNGRARSATPPPPVPPTLYPTVKSIMCPDDTDEWFTIEHAYRKEIEFVEFEEACYDNDMSNGECIKVPGPPTSREQDDNDPFLNVDTLEGRWHLLADHGYAFRAQYDAWINEVNVRRLRDGIEDLIPVREGYKFVGSDEVKARMETLQHRMRENYKEAMQLAKSQREEAEKEAARSRALKRAAEEKLVIKPVLKRAREEDEEEKEEKEDVERSPKKVRFTEALPTRSPSSSKPSSKFSRRSPPPDTTSTTPSPTSPSFHLVGSSKTSVSPISVATLPKATPDPTAPSISPARRSPGHARDLSP